MDMMDRAQELADLHLQDALAQRQQAARPPALTALECHGCDRPIPEARRLAVPGCCLCVDCQAAAERVLGR
jgi:phage/conjugal plasmid C-4 type zinc finger TraR family protein